MRDYVSKQELENYWDEPPLGFHPDLVKKLDELLKKGQYNDTKPNK
jgi:hypothetical protein